jgi:outer membrane protein TolC
MFAPPARALVREAHITPVSIMNVKALIARAPDLALAAAVSLYSVTGQAQQAAPAKPAATVDKAPPAAAQEEAAPIEKFDLAAVLRAESGGLTADDAAKRARARAPQIAAARANANVAKIDIDSSWTAFIPTIDLGAQYKRVSYVNNAVGGGMPPPAPAPGSVEEAVGNALGEYFRNLDFTLPRDQWSLSANAQWAISDVFLRAWPAYKANVGSAAAQKIQVEVTEAAVELTARNAFYDYARALAQRAVDEQSLKQAEAQAAQIKLFVDAGTVAQVDHMTAVARVEEARSAIANSEARVMVSRNTLATLLGTRSEEITGVAEPVLEAPEPPTTPETDLMNKAFAQRPELRALRKLVQANDALVAAQRGGALPQLVLSAGDLYASPNPRKFPPTEKFYNTWEVGAGINWRLNNSANGYYATQKAKAQLTKAQADLNAQQDAVRIEVVTALQNYKAAQAVSAASQARLAASEEAYRVRLATYRVGAGVIVDLLNADLAVSQARLALAFAAINARSALAALRRAAALDS